MTLDTKRIKSQLDELVQADPGDAWRWRTSNRWTEEELATFEAEHRLKLPTDYRAWLRDVDDGNLGFIERGKRSLKSQSNEELARAAKPFRIRADVTKPPKKPVNGVLHLGTDGQLCPFYLVTSGTRAGEVWVNGDGWGDSVFCKEGTFAELSEAWIKTVVNEARANVAPRDAAKELEVIAPKDRFGHLIYSGFISWLRQGPPALFADALTHVAAPDRRDLIDRFVRAIDGEKRWVADPVLARVAAETLAAVLARAEEPTDVLDEALDAMFDPDPPDIAPERVTAWVSAMATRRGKRDDRINRWTGRWLQHELVRIGRVEEAIVVWRHRVYLGASDWVEFARDLIAIGRSDIAFAIADERKFSSGQHWGRDDHARVRAWMHFEAGDRDKAIMWMERQVEECDHCAPELEMLRSTKKGVAIQSPSNLTSDSDFERPRARRGDRHHELVALLYGVAGDGEHMADSAVDLLSRPHIARNPKERAIHVAHLRMGRALTNGHAADREPLVAHYGPGLRGHLAKAIFAQTGDLNIELK